MVCMQRMIYARFRKDYIKEMLENSSQVADWVYMRIKDR